MSIKSTFRYEIYDDDVGDVLHEVDYHFLNDVLEDVKRDIHSYSPFDYTDEDDEIEKDDNIYWSPKFIIDSLLNFNFYGGLLEWSCWFPGHHRKLTVRIVKQKI